MTKDEALSAKHEGATTVALKLALEALETGKPMFNAYWGGSQFDNAITTIREALALSESSTKCEETSHAQPECYHEEKIPMLACVKCGALCGTPAGQRTWVGLTKADKKEIERVAVYVDGAIRLTEAKLREKNT